MEKLSFRLTNQEVNVLQYLSTINRDVAWEELAQFAKNPQTVQLKTIKKIISDLKKKYSLEQISFPFTYNFFSLASPPSANSSTVKAKIVSSPTGQTGQVMVKVKTTPAGNVMPITTDVKTYACQTDFKLNRNTKSVVTTYGSHLLSDSAWEIIKYFHENPERIIAISELRDKVVYPQYGSKLPPKWFDNIARSIHVLRKQVPSLKNRLITLAGLGETSYMLK